MSVITIKDKKEAEEIIRSTKHLVLHFYADWVLQCQNMNDVIHEMSKLPDFSSVKFVVLPAEELAEISLRFNVVAVPTVVLLRDGEQVSRIEGANPALLRDKLKAMVEEGGRKKDTTTRLKELINSHHIMLFMKGNASEPRCGFSRQIVEILNGLAADYKTFDILNDQEVRESLKTYSKWPTYPQLYISGELIGGLDIVKEMVNSGDLQAMLPAAGVTNSNQQISLEQRLKDLTNSHNIMVFMKGDRVTPRCGFSRQLVQILNEIGSDYKTFDILEDNSVREGLKEYSKWPTYPQLYAKGELIGGLDICKELHQSGELKQLLS